MSFVLCTTCNDQKWIFCTLVTDLQYSRKALFLHILANFSKLDGFKVDSFFPKEMALATFSSPEMTFSRNPANSAFLFWHYSQERKRGIHWNFSFFNQFWRFLSNWKIWCYTNFKNFRMDTTYMFFYQNNSFQDSNINHLRCLRKSLPPHILARSS